jgi:hypothetical protein
MLREETRISKNPTAAIIIPNPIFFGVDGSIPFLFNQANTLMTSGAIKTIKRDKELNSAAMSYLISVPIHILKRTLPVHYIPTSFTSLKG